MPRRVMEQAVAEQATGCRATTNKGQLYLTGEIKVTDAEARTHFDTGGVIHDPNAGAGSYRSFLERLGFNLGISAFETGSSAGDWTILVELTPDVWTLMSQENRYPFHGFRYSRSHGEWYGTEDEVSKELAEGM